MKKFIEEYIIVVMVMLVLGMVACVGVGIQTHTMMMLADVNSKIIFTTMLLFVIGFSFIVFPCLILYDIISGKDKEIRSLATRVVNMGTTGQAPRRGYESAHWQTDVVIEDDLDGDGSGDDSLRRLGAIQ
jgi:hypothetical protein